MLTYPSLQHNARVLIRTSSGCCLFQIQGRFWDGFRHEPNLEIGSPSHITLDKDFLLSFSKFKQAIKPLLEQMR